MYDKNITKRCADDELFGIKLKLGWFRYESIWIFFVIEKWLFLYHSWETGGEKNKFAIFLQLDFNGFHINIYEAVRIESVDYTQNM